MTILHFDLMLTPDGWREDQHVTIEAGRIAAIATGRPHGSESHAIGLPGLPNVHSHAFQRGMSGLAERRGLGDDSFWSWRETMYRFALAMGPSELEAVAAQLYVEMLEAGFTRVGEFHYLHHDSDGSPYADVAEMACRIAAAAEAAGLNLTLLPVLYRHSSFGSAPPSPEQRRFVTDLDGYADLLSRSHRAIGALEGADIGVAPHSLRAVAPADLAAIVGLAGRAPVHIHIAEQQREVEACLATTGARPVAWLLDHAPVDERWCLVHATHMTPAEARDVARRRATVGLCPVTEASLGDGVFDAVPYLAAGGAYGIGSDSNISVDAAGELRQLEYSQRLWRQERNVIGASGRSTGQVLFEHAIVGGNAALGQGQTGLAAGTPADIVSLDRNHPALVGHHRDTILDAWVFGAGRDAIDCVWTHGRKQVEGGRHYRRERVAARFAVAMARLTA